MRHTPTGYALIHLADDEWGNRLMDQVAREYFQEQPECNFVEVYEHAGWYLAYRRDGSICGTANDMAVLKPGPQREMCERVIRRGTDTDYWVLDGRVIHTKPQLSVYAA